MTGTTPGGAQQRAAFLDGAVRYVLHHGITGLALRPLAAALGTSDRMLLYYFGSRDDLLAAVLGAVGEQLRSGLEQALPSAPLPPAALLQRAWAALQAPAAEPHLRLYLEVSGLAVRGQQPHGAMAGEVARQWLAWIGTRLDVPAEDGPGAAAALLTVLDGLLLVRFVASEEAAARAADWLGPRLG